MAEHSSPDLDSLVAAGNLVAAAMGLPPPDAETARAFFLEILHQPQAEGGRDLWGCFEDGLLTEIELRDATMARFATWISLANGRCEPSSDAWSSAAIEERFEWALRGHRAADPRRR